MAVDWDKSELDAHRRNVRESREARDHKFTEAEVDRAAHVAKATFKGQTTWGDAAKAGIASVKVDRERP